MQDDHEERTVGVLPAIVVNEAQRSEPIQEETYPSAPRAYQRGVLMFRMTGND